MPFTSHLDELRHRLIRIIIGNVAGFLVCYGFAEKLVSILQKPYGRTLVFLFPAEAFYVTLKVAFFAAIWLETPLILYEVWSFVSPGLKDRERKFAKYFIFYGTGLFFLGIMFCYFVVLPFVMSFLLSYQGDIIRPMISATNYISFVTLLMFTFGVVFDLPLLVVMLTLIGIVTPDMMRKNRKFALMFMLVLAAILTPPDVFSQIIMTIPLIILYEVSIIVSSRLVQ